MGFSGQSNKYAQLRDPALCWEVKDVFSEGRCRQLIEMAEAKGFLRVGHGTPKKQIRHNKRVIVTDAALAEELFGKVKEVVPASLVGLEPVGANDWLRFYKYGQGDFFRPHKDNSLIINPTRRSFLSIVVYLNDDFEGGQLHLPGQGRDIQPRPGLAVVFSHWMVHESRPITEGVKYAFRSDVIYGAVAS